MRLEGTFVAERLGAQHCAELLRGSRQAANPLVELARFGERLADLLGPQLGALCPGAKALVEVGEPVELQAGMAHDRRGDVVLNSTMGIGPRDAMIIASLPQTMLLSLVDLALGGTGKDCALPGGKLPTSAQLMFNRFEKIVGSAVADALNLEGPDTVRFKGQSITPHANAPFAGCKRALLPVRLTVGGAEPCELVFTFPGACVATLFAERSAPAAAEAQAARPSPGAEPFGGIPLPLKAILVDMAIPVSTLARLKPGMVIPVNVARSVPLMAGEQVIAHGTVGAMDDCTALQITRISEIREY